MSEIRDPRELAALDWARRIADPDFADWDAHLAWLEEHPANSAALDRMLLALDAVDGALTGPRVVPVANDNGSALPPAAADWRGRTRWLPLAAAAAVLGAIGIGVLAPHDEAIGRTIATKAGQPRLVRFADGSRLALNGDSMIRVSGKRDVALLRGEMLLDVRHDAARPMRVEAAGLRFVDVGTRFNVRRDGADVALAVGEGSVALDPDGADLRLAAGQGLIRQAGRIVVAPVDRQAVGSWTRGQLVYRDARVADVAVDIARSTGARVAVEADVAAVRFSGVITRDGDAERMLRRFAAVAGVGIRRRGDGWLVAVR